MAKILILNGPNLNLLGLRNPEHYGVLSLTEIEQSCRSRFPNHELNFLQSNHEGVLIDAVQQTDANAIVINGGGFTHPWGASFRETLLHANYQHKGMVFNLLYSFGPRSIDLGADFPNNGADPLRSYNDRTNPLGYFIGQNGGMFLHLLQFRAGYIVNAATGMRIEAGMTIRRETNVTLPSDQYTPLPTNAFFVGLNIPFGNMYTDF